MSDFEFSEADRFRTSYLGVIESASIQRNRPNIKRNTLDTSVIPGAQADTSKQRRITQFTNRPYFFGNKDIVGSNVPTLIPKIVNKANDRHLNNRDIAYSYPLKNAFRTARVVDPLNPQYVLPSYEIREEAPPKQLRHTNKIDDIRGTHSLPLYPGNSRDNINYNDVRGSTVGKLTKERNVEVDSLKVADINTEGIFKTKRNTNPLTPRYTYDNEAKHDIGGIKGTHPREQPKLRKDRPLFSLRTKDIPNMYGPRGHKVPTTFPKPENRRQYRNINHINDINGAQSSGKYTTFHAEQGRTTNPLNPKYVFLDGPKEKAVVKFGRRATKSPPTNDKTASSSQNSKPPATTSTQTIKQKQAEQQRKEDINMVAELK